MIPGGEDVDVLLFGSKVVVNHIDTGRRTGCVDKSGGQPGLALDPAGKEHIVIVGSCSHNFGIGFRSLGSVEPGPAGLTGGKRTAVVAQCGNPCQTQSDLGIESRSGNGLTAALAAAGNDQDFAVPFGTGLDIVQRPHQTQIHTVVSPPGYWKYSGSFSGMEDWTIPNFILISKPAE